MTNLRIERLSKKFGSFTALDDVSLEIPTGKFVCLLGPSGCGKTTLLRVVAGLETPTKGRVVVDGDDQTKVPTHRRDMGMVFQSLALFPHLDVAGNITYPLAIRGADRAKRDAKADELLKLVRLPGMGARRIDQLSGGQRQRVAIARGLAIDPKVFLLDEPLSALDAGLREHMQIELRQIQQSLGVTTIVVTHDQKEALTMADLVIVMKDGVIQQAGAPMEIYRNPANAFVAGFIGTTNLLPCTVRDGAIEVLGARLPIAEGDRIALEQGEAQLSIRPEHVAIEPAGAGGIEAEVTFLRDLGESRHVLLDAQGQEITAQLSPETQASYRPGDRVSLSFRPGERVVVT
ncbi:MULTISPECIES: ABC transporter ATP-binding protein [Thioclava]|uniref:Polyamine ABC transporter ATP-binding protein n=1 Tax=Thioclava nitratireducens TaxID=1915078 RepID=A0ABM6IFB7_9RHOB|nr:MULTISPECIES: ABC transporter ATP-binding protein [Thioclava]AQS47368.1 polyamine ABC transporter ATP-binding protein [Thioclava nitratireducens]OWY05911.1 polyamine ABC transporter ATP-binding protein [Thioclava sp. F1Mire-8]OWY11204.1 polyamine ABC transporter ATP-binding protein [Thioclava sp. F42-5]OWY13724.1 polyamine ABC transporter ATP-binding protein [Thioclava sp. F34-6]OWY17788.1 polyamine ABC transporter ATP-binding protein [Thioclava sp. JM3]